MNYFNDLNYEITNNPNYTALSSFMFGILFSGISYGLVYVIIFIILTEFLYYGYLDCNDKNWIAEQRLLVIAAGLLGFFLGRFLLDDDDHHGEFIKFQNDYHHYGRECGWFDVKQTDKRLRRKKKEKIQNNSK